MSENEEKQTHKYILKKCMYHRYICELSELIKKVFFVQLQFQSIHTSQVLQPESFLMKTYMKDTLTKYRKCVLTIKYVSFFSPNFS